MKRDTSGKDQINRACKRSDKRVALVLRPSLLKRRVERMLPESSLNIFSSYKVEDYQHAMEQFDMLVLHWVFANELERSFFTCMVGTIDKVYHLYSRFCYTRCSCLEGAMKHGRQF